jgi:1-acyl-sn-glycerol-3-phosphate acyltransferase
MTPTAPTQTETAAEPVSHSQFALLKERRFAPFFWTQFLGAMNDNVFKVSLTGLITYQAWSAGDMSPQILVNIIAALFILPFVLFSATSGQLADKFEKAKLMRFVKALEIAFMAVAAIGFVLHNVPLLLLTVFLMGLHSTLFGPVKYSYLPQHLRTEELTGGNGLVESGTFIAILVGTIAAGFLANAAPLWSAVSVVAIALAGYLVSRSIPLSPAADPNLQVNWNPFTETMRNLKLAHGNVVVFRSLLGISWLWFFGATFLTQFAPFAKNVLKGDASVFTALLTIFSIGIAVGSLLCEKLSEGKVEIGLVPLGSIGMSVFALDLYFASRGITSQIPAAQISMGALISDPKLIRVCIDLFLLALFGGLYSVPLYALIQERTQPSHRSRIIAANNILNALFMVASAGLAIALFRFGATIPQVFLATAILNALVALYIYSLTPEFLMRFLTWILIHTVYRIKKSGLDHIPATGPALIVANHVSYMDALVMGGACKRPIRFVMDHNIFKIPVLSFIFRTGKAIPIAPEREDPAAKERAYAEIAKALREGDVVAIYPEGKLTADGKMNPFRPGFLRIIEDTPVPVIPTALRGLWGSFFSRSDEGRAFRKLRGLFSRIEWVVGPPIPAAAVSLEKVENAVKQLRGDAA